MNSWIVNLDFSTWRIQLISLLRRLVIFLEENDKALTVIQRKIRGDSLNFPISCLEKNKNWLHKFITSKLGTRYQIK